MLTDRTAINQLSYKVIGCAITVHRELGPGLLERPYVLALAEELKLAGLAYRLGVPVPVVYRGKRLGRGYEVDCLVEGAIVLEVKSVRIVTEVHRKQLMAYLKLTKLPLGLLINFNVNLLRDGITRMINLPKPAREAQALVSDSNSEPARRALRGGG